MENPASDILVQLFPIMLIQAVLLFAVVPLARACSRIAWLWVVLAIVPGIGLIALLLLLGRSVAKLARRVDALAAKTEAKQQ